MRIGILGCPGAGKTTQAKILSKNLNVPYISTGELLRDFAKQQVEGADEIKEDMVKGELVDNELLAKLLKEHLAQANYQQGYILDGFPRSLDQLRAYDPGFDKVFNLEIDDHNAEDRLLKRGRMDDSPEAIVNRLEEFHLETKKVVDHFKSLGIVTTINGNQAIEEVASEIAAHFKR